jgi:putative acetyltransferase
VNLRLFVPDDANVLVEIYRDAVLNLGAKSYSEEQVQVWVSYPEELEEFCGRLVRGRTVVAEAGGNPVAFGQLDPVDHIAFLYCRGAWSRRGVASAIYQDLEKHAGAQHVSALRVEASRISKPFFERHGFEVVEVENVIRHGVEFERFRMRKNIPSGRLVAPAEGAAP